MTTHPTPTGILRPSSASRWGPDGCAGSHALEALYPEDQDSPEAREGTAAHFWPTEALEGRIWPIGHLAPNGHPIDADMIRHGQEWIDDIALAVSEVADPQALFRVETKVFAHHLVHPQNEGTPDAFLVSLLRRRLILWDYKYGHKYIDAYRFWQGINYIAGIFEQLSLTREDVADMRISIRVVQPRNYHIAGPIRTWETTGAVVWAMIEQLSFAAHMAKAVGAPTRTGPHCEDCNGRHACEAFMRRTARDADYAGETTPVELPPAAMGAELKRIASAIKRLEARRDGLAAQAVAIIDRGGVVPGWSKGYVNSHEKWKVPDAEVKMVGEIFGIDLSKNSVKTPAEARKLGIDATVIATYSFKPTGAAKLVPVDATAAEKAFGQPT